MQTNDFNLVPDDTSAPQSADFAAVPDGTPEASTGPTPVKTAVMSIASAPDTRIDTYQAMLDQNLKSSDDLIKSGQEFGQRLKIANDRQQRQMKQLNSMRGPDSPITPETSKAVDAAYNDLAQQDIVTHAQTAAEMETVRRVQDDLTAGNTVEAKVTYNLLTNGNAEQVFAKEAAKQLILAQAAERYANEGHDQSWGSWLYNQATSLIPTEYNFSRSGIVPGAKTGIKNFFLSGSNLQSQGQLMYDKYRDPTDLANALKPGGELDASIRSNSTTLGGYSPQTAEELTHSLAYQSHSDKMWANIWGVADAGTVALPEIGVVPWKSLKSVPGALTRMGARSAARDTVVDAWDTILKDSADATVSRSGLSEDDVVRNMETSSMNPGAATEHDAPLAVDVHTRIEASKSVLKNFPINNPASSFTNPEELLNAYQGALADEEARIGQSVKDHKFMYEDLGTGEKAPFSPGKLPESGNIMPYVEYSVGKKDGGFFATARSAKAEATKRGLWDPEIAYDEVANEYKVIDPEFDIVGYHGTASAFDQYDSAFAGKLTDAKSAKMGTFFTNNPDVAWTYAQQAAKDNAISLVEFKKASSQNAVMARRFANFRESLGLRPASTEAEIRSAAETAGKLPEFIKIRDAWDSAASTYGRIRNETSVSGQNVRPVKIRMKNPYVHDYANELHNGYNEQSYSAIISKARADGHDGVILRNTDDTIGEHPLGEDIYNPENASRLNSFRNHDVYVVFDNANIKTPWDATRIQRDVSGQFVIKNRVNVKEDGFHTAPLNTPSNQFLGGLRSDARRLDRSAQVKAVSGGQNTEHLTSALTHAMRGALKGLSKEDKRTLDEVIRKGQNENRWLSDREFSMLWERATDKAPSDRALDAYRQHIVFNDIEYTMRNDLERLRFARQGYETAEFNLGFGDSTFRGNAKIEGNPSIVPPERVFNVSDKIHYTADNQLTEAELKRLGGDGYLLVKTKDPVYLADGTTVRNFLIKRGEMKRSPLELQQLGYTEGGHRLYTGKYFAKQATFGVQPDTGQEFLKNPNVFRTSNNPNTLREWADTMNAAISEYKRGILDPQHYDDNIFSAVRDPRIAMPTGKEFIKAADEGAIDLTHPIEVVGDREMPSAYATTASSVSRFIDPEETSASGYYRTTGRLYNSKRGEHLLDVSGEYAETVDPWKAMNQAITNISKMSSFESYKQNVLERFDKTYGRFLALDNPSQANAVTLLEAKVGPNVPAELARRIKAEQAGAKRIMGFETEWEKGVKQAHKDLASWVLGDAKGGARQMAHDFIWHLKDNNPVAFLRGVAFDAKLGMFNVGQLLLQSSTMLASLAIHPEGGLRAMMSSMPLVTHALSNGSEAVLDVFAKRSWKMAGFSSEQDMKEFARFVDRSGFMKVGNTHLLLNTYGSNKVFGAASAVDGVRQAGRSMFYLGEQFNRAVAGRLAYEDLRKQGLEVGTAAFRERWIGLADDLTFNMTHESSAAFQHGLWSIPTQFWAYNVRMMDAMFGNAFTGAQKARLLASQFLFFGAGGVPVAAALDQYWKERSGKPVSIDSIAGMIDRGLIDKAIHETTGADVRFGERVGTGPFLTDTIKSIFGTSEYGQKSAFDVLGGATFSISGQLGKTMWDAGRYALAESGGDQGFQLTEDNLMKLADNVSTFGNAHKAMLAYRYGYYRSSTGSIQATNLPPADAFWTALGLGQPQELTDSSIMYNYLNNKDEVVKEAAKQVRNWRQEAFTNPDKYDENLQKVNAYVRLLPPDIQNQVLKQTNKITDQSFYDHVAQKYQQEKASETGVNQ